MTAVLGVVLLGMTFLVTDTVAFVPIGPGISHVNITATALMTTVTEACQAVVEGAGYQFQLQGSSPEELVQACLGPTATGLVSGSKFYTALQEIYTQNGLVDRDFANSAPHHFNSEAFLEGRALIVENMAAIKASVRTENFHAAREALGRVLHTLQDFYSHSNWVELGNTKPFTNLLRPDLPLENLADIYTPTCRDCENGWCPDSLLPEILEQKKLTSGYMGLYYSTKPQGKCSHGGKGDLTSTVKPRGGISKDERRSDNFNLHNTAVVLATDASVELLEDIRLSVGDKDFLRMMGIARSSVVCFVIDTTGSMSDDIAEARKVVSEIIDSKRGTQDEPSEYIMVPFNDPDFGPMVRTPDPEKIKAAIAALKPRGGGDSPEMCLSGLQLALTGAPASSQIYVFTDAEAKDIELKNTIIALIRRTKSSVSFFITNSGRRRRRRSTEAAFIADYKDLAVASGGQAITVSKRDLPQATTIIRDTSTSALVTILQQVVKPGKHANFTFMLDESLQNVTIYITGSDTTFTLTNPAGESQKNTEASGKLGTIQAVGNLRRISLNPGNHKGKWKIVIDGTQPYTLKVTGQSIITFIYNFVEKFGGPHAGYAVLSGRPREGQPATLLLSVIGGKGRSSMSIEGIGLVPVSGLNEVGHNSKEDLGGGDILVTVDSVPAGEFLVKLTGKDKVSNSDFQRHSTTLMSVSKVNIEAVATSSMEPGKRFEVPFSVMTQGPSGPYSFTVKNDGDFPLSHPKKLSLTTGVVLNDTITIIPSPQTHSGTVVTLTMEIKSESGDDSNYAVLRLTVVKKITDFVPPKCGVVNVQDGDCPEDMAQCGAFQWNLSANLTDGNGTGIEVIMLRKGNGTLTHTTVNSTYVEVQYKASCCAQFVEFIAVDEIGNVGRCSNGKEIVSGGPPVLTLSLPMWLCLLVFAFVVKP